MSTKGKGKINPSEGARKRKEKGKKEVDYIFGRPAEGEKGGRGGLEEIWKFVGWNREKKNEGN